MRTLLVWDVSWLASTLRLLVSPFLGRGPDLQASFKLGVRAKSLTCLQVENRDLATALQRLIIFALNLSSLSGWATFFLVDGPEKTSRDKEQGLLLLLIRPVHLNFRTGQTERVFLCPLFKA